MPDYVNYICPQFSRTHINFQRVPRVDTSNPFIARYIPTADESMEFAMQLILTPMILKLMDARRRAIGAVATRPSPS